VTNAWLLDILAQAKPPPSPLAPGGGTTWMPPQGSTTARETDLVFYFIYWVSVFFFILIVGLMVYFAIRYRRRRPGQAAEGTATHNTALELTWTVVPLILVVVMFTLGFKGFMDITNPPGDALEIYVNARKWSWSFTYPNGLVDNELHVPVDRPVRLILNSVDVIHSFFIPAFRVKKDAVPGRYNKLWFECPKPGEYVALCAEYCGTEHSNMWTRVVVHERGLWEKWLEETSDPFRTRTPVQVGELMYKKHACNTCHSLDGTRSTGPTFKGLWGTDPALRGGGRVHVDENYIRESILEPQAKIVDGYDPVMPTYKGQIKDREIMALIEYLKTLK
jgi:cytochrome c oxidase subunit 2